MLYLALGLIVFLLVYFALSFMHSDKTFCPECDSTNVTTVESVWNLSHSVTKHIHCNGCGHDFEIIVSD